MELFPSEAAVRYLVRTLFLLTAVLFVTAAGSQSQPATAAPPEPRTAPAEADPQFPRRQQPRPEDRFEIERQRQMERERNKERQAELKKDTDRLLELAGELKQYVDKTDENILSLEVIKKAEEIEKLSKSVKEKMKADAYYPPIGAPQPR